jgi:hypothetical protein
MEVDDVEDKFRRNLVVASTTVLLCTFLDVPMSSLANKLIGDQGSNLSPWKLLCACLALMTYLGLRYWHSDVRSQAYNSLWAEAERLRSGYVQSAIQRDLDRYTSKGMLPHRFLDPGDLVNTIEAACAASPAHQHGLEGCRPSLRFTWGDPGDPEERGFAGEVAGSTAARTFAGSGAGEMAKVFGFAGKGRISWGLQTGGGMSAGGTGRTKSGSPISYSIPPVPAWAMRLRAWTRAVANSRAGMEFAWVICLATLAFLVLLWKLWCLR